MADQKEEEPQEEEMPVAEDDDAKEEEKKDDGDGAAKEEKAPMFRGTPKKDPGEHFCDQYPDKKDPRGEPDVIQFKWRQDVKSKKDCNTIEMLYLLQLACEKHRERTNQRNKYFTSIKRTDRYLFHVDTPQIITNFLEWHNEDTEHNLFTGEMMETKETMFKFLEMISEIGDTKKGPATRIFTKLRKEVVIEHDQWTEQKNTKLKLFTWGMKKLYSGEKVLAECTVEDVIILFTFYPEAADEKKDDDDATGDDDSEKVTLDGVLFCAFEKKKNKGQQNMCAVDGWKEKLIGWIRENNVDGQKLLDTAPKALTPGMMSALIPDTVMNAKGKKANQVLKGPCNKMVNYCKKMKVHLVLAAAAEAAAAQK